MCVLVSIIHYLCCCCSGTHFDILRRLPAMFVAFVVVVVVALLDLVIVVVMAPLVNSWSRWCCCCCCCCCSCDKIGNIWHARVTVLVYNANAAAVRPYCHLCTCMCLRVCMYVLLVCV